jgi:uncharacterized protein
LGFVAGSVRAAEVIPHVPAAYFNDYASVVSAPTAAALNAKLEQFERETSNQLVVVIYPTMQSDSSIDDYTERVAQSWHLGTNGKDNGAALFVFVDSHKMSIEVGYGLEAKLTDALSKDIISDQIAPAFRKGDFDGGVTAGVNAMIAATLGEYHGTGHTVNDQRNRSSSPPIGFIFLAFIFIIFISTMRRRAAMYQSGGRRGLGGLLPFFLLGGGGGFGGGGGGGGGFGGGGGGFSAGGGSFGGGGASGSW